MRRERASFFVFKPGTARSRIGATHRVLLGGLIAVAVLALCVMVGMIDVGSSRRGRATSGPDSGPPLGEGTILEPGVRLYKTSSRSGNLSAPVRIYVPEGVSGKIPCVLISPSNRPLLNGMDLTDNDRPEHIPYVKAGFVVVAFSVSGGSKQSERPTEAELVAAVREFKKADAGVINAQQALDYALAQIPQIDPDRIFTAGYGSAGTLALLVAAKDERIHGCVAFAPITNVVARAAGQMSDLAQAIPRLKEFIDWNSPMTHSRSIRCPVLLFHADDDDTVPVQESERFADAARATNPQVVLVRVPQGGHSQALLEQGVPRAIQWLHHQQSATHAVVAAKDVKTMQPAGKLEAFTTLAFTGDGKSCLALTPAGQLLVYSYPDFQQRGTCRVSTSGDLAAFDLVRNLLYVVNAGSQGAGGASSQNELHVYDVGPVVANPATPGSALRPKATHALDGQVKALFADGDSGRLFYTSLAGAKGSDDIYEVRSWDGASAGNSGKASLPGLFDFRLAPDGNHGFAICRSYKIVNSGAKQLDGAVVHQVKLRDLVLHRSSGVPVEPATESVAGLNDGIVFLSDEKDGISVVEVPKREVLGRWKGVPAHCRLQLSPNQRWLFWWPAASEGALHRWLVPADAGQQPPGDARSLESSTACPLGGEYFVSPDGKYAISSLGGIVRIEE